MFFSPKLTASPENFSGAWVAIDSQMEEDTVSSATRFNAQSTNLARKGKAIEAKVIVVLSHFFFLVGIAAV